MNDDDDDMGDDDDDKDSSHIKNMPMIISNVNDTNTCY
jgi:hypothetical protein